MFKAIIRMMDVPTALSLLAPRVQRLGRGGALLIFSCCLVCLGPLAYLWWKYDLSSTWNWFGWLVGDQTVAEGQVRAVATRAGADNDTAGLVIILFGFGFTLLPSAVQVGLARLVNVPALGFLVKVALGFDLVTDWGPMWELAAKNTWFDTTFRWWPLAGLARLIAAAVGAVLASVVIQSAVILISAALIYLAAVILLGPPPARPTATIEQ
jgi:hypothetical protein